MYIYIYIHINITFKFRPLSNLSISHYLSVYSIYLPYHKISIYKEKHVDVFMYIYI